MPQTAVPPEPNWLEFANDIFEALTRSSSAHWAFATKSTSARTPLKRGTTPQSDCYEDIDPVMAAMFTGYHAATASKAFRKKRPCADVAQSILRFSKTFGALSQFETQLHAYGRIMLMNVAPDLHEAVHNLVPHILKMTEVTQKAFVIDLEDVLDPAPSDGSVLSAAFTEKLNGDVPILILASSHAPLPIECRALISTTVTLPPLDAALLSAHLSWFYATKTTCLACADDPDYAGIEFKNLGMDKLACALREPTRRRALCYLATHCPTRPPETDRGLATFPLPDAHRAPLQQMLEDLKDWQTGQLDWKDVLQGILLVGPPGTGKTEIARLLARDAGVNVHATSVARWQSSGGRSGNVVQQMRQFFQNAQRDAACIVFIDELDAAGSRTRPQDHNSAWTQMVTTALLECLDGFDGREGIIIVAATNDPDNIDPALRRAGRFDTKLTLMPPTPDLLPQVLRWHLPSDLLDLDLSQFALQMIGMSGAEIAELVRRARAQARKHRRPLQKGDLETALQVTRPALADAVRHCIAVHEAGHAVVAMVTRNVAPHLLAVLPNGSGLMQKPTPPQIENSASLKNELAVLLAGRAAEQLVLGEISTGAGGDDRSDLAQATHLAVALETSLGLGSDGLCWLGTPQHMIPQLSQNPGLRERVETHLAEAETRATAILHQYRPILDRLTTRLCETGVLTEHDLEPILAALCADTPPQHDPERRHTSPPTPLTPPGPNPGSG